MKVIISTKNSRDYYTPKMVGYYLESILKYIKGNAILITAKSIGKKNKKIVFELEVVKKHKIEALVEVLENWDVEFIE